MASDAKEQDEFRITCTDDYAKPSMCFECLLGQRKITLYGQDGHTDSVTFKNEIKGQSIIACHKNTRSGEGYFSLNGEMIGRKFKNKVFGQPLTQFKIEVVLAAGKSASLLQECPFKVILEEYKAKQAPLRQTPQDDGAYKMLSSLNLDQFYPSFR